MRVQGINVADEHRGIVNDLGTSIVDDKELGLLYQPIFRSVREILSSAITGCMENMTDDRLRQRSIEFSIIDDEQPQALAVPGQAGDHILLTKGLVSACFGLAASPFAQPDFLSYIGEASLNERVPFEVGHRWPATHTHRVPNPPATPQCQRRLALAQYIAREGMKP
ncbi:MAG: hypothetical protein SGJ09_16320 [Phycisphaerae bacterium]|nr:hypothetical protein [Phycisphaerae bacterium]